MGLKPRALVIYVIPDLKAGAMIFVKLIFVALIPTLAAPTKATAFYLGVARTFKPGQWYL